MGTQAEEDKGQEPLKDIKTTIMVLKLLNKETRQRLVVIL